MYTRNSCLATLDGPSNNFKRILSFSFSLSLSHLQSQGNLPLKKEDSQRRSARVRILCTSTKKKAILR